MALFIKKPVVIEARQYDGSAKSAMEIVQWMGVDEFEQDFIGQALTIHTLEGDMTASVWDWVIKGIAGEFYPCKPNIFEATYTPY